MTQPADDLAELSARVLVGLPRRTDGSHDAKDVSSALRELRASLTRQLAAQEAEYSRLDDELKSLGVSAPRESQTFQREIRGTMESLEQVGETIDVAESHFASVVALLEPATQRLQKLDARAKYLETALEIERRSQEAKAHAVQATVAALDAFQAFSSFVQTIPSEYAALHREAMRRVDELSFGIKQFAVEKLQAALEAVEWPRVIPEKEFDEQKHNFDEIARAFSYLLSLHVSQLQAESRKTEQEESKTVELWAIECLLEPIRMRFKYHFERAESKTNRITKPEWWLSHVVDQTRAHAHFLATVVTPELTKRRDTLDCVDAQGLFLRGLTLTAMKKLRKDLPATLSERAVFCHTIDEILLFEQLVDDEFGYDSYAGNNSSNFPRVVDVLTEDTKTLFAWTNIDAEYAKETLSSTILSEKDAWIMTQRVPRAAQQCVALLDFMCRRFAHLGSEGHRYLYISQVLFVLLSEFHSACAEHSRRVNVNKLTDSLQPLTPLLAAVNGAQHVIHVLQAWDENPFFIELVRKVAESDQSRTQILKMHLEHSKAMLKNVASAATKTIMAREEAVAVRQAIAGPGAMIGPTAAFSAAYSVGSKTVKSLFGRGADDPATETSEPDEGQNNADSEPSEVQQEAETVIDAETLLFSRTIFERQVKDYKSLIVSLIGEVKDSLISSWRHALYRYRKSNLWTQKSISETIDQDVSSELGFAVMLLRQILNDGHKILVSDESFSQLWKPLVSALDDVIFSTVISVLTNAPAPLSGSTFSLANAATAIGAVEPLSASSRTEVANEPIGWSTAARAQFLVDVAAIASVFQSTATKNPRAYLRKTYDLCRLVEMPPTKLIEIHEAIRDVDGEDGSTMEQITTILEACNILTLTPQQVRTFCEEQLGVL